MIIELIIPQINSLELIDVLLRAEIRSKYCDGIVANGYYTFKKKSKGRYNIY
jgi:hypothetical protein